jgi:hypothetical protein
VRAGFFAIALATGAAAAGTVEVLNPFLPVVHAWWFALAAGIAGAYLLAVGATTVLGRHQERPAALAALGGALLAACVAFASFLVGSPDRVPAAPGQTFRPPRSTNVQVVFPNPTIAQGSLSQWPDSVTILDGTKPVTARSGDVVRAGPFVFRVTTGPIAHVDARSPSGAPVTTTQPDGPAFLSPYLTFAGLDGDRPEDYFAVPSLHRNVQVDYWPGLPSHGIGIPFLALRISEENGGALYEGVVVSGRPLRKAGVTLRFTLGTYPVLYASSAPPLIPYWAGLAMFAAGWVGYASRAIISGRSAATQKDTR